MVEGLHGSGIQAKVLMITTDQWRHALAVYLYPVGENRLWCWDSNWKSIRVRAFFAQPESVAKAWLKATNHAQSLEKAEYL